jgi:hypothetical protein
MQESEHDVNVQTAVVVTVMNVQKIKVHRCCEN